MLRSIGQLYGRKLGVLDGEIGHLKDFYFDDKNWAVRYVAAETGIWLASRQVLLSPHALGKACLARKVLTVNLTRKQIEDSPSLEWHKPVSRQFEEEYYRYYGWPNYWQGDGLWGMNGSPFLRIPAKPLPTKRVAVIEPRRERADAHLHSTRTLKGYNIQAGSEIIGHVCDFIMDYKSWAIRQLVIKTTGKLFGKKMQIPPRKVDRINYMESTMFVNLT
jgi:hypothetical protein